MRQIVIIVLIFISFGWSKYATADLLIAPTRIAFTDRDRTHQVTLINSGTTTRTYRVEWVEQTLTENGEYLQGVPSDFNKASDYLRFSPKQVRLQGGERQVIKLLLRKPNDFKDGEYRSHLKFVALPADSSVDNPVGEGISMKLNVLLSYTIPILIRQGQFDGFPNIEQVRVANKPNSSKKTIFVYMKKNTKTGFIGNVVSYFKAKDGSEKEVARLNGVNFFHEQPARRFALTTISDIPAEPGELITRFTGAHEYSGKLLAEHKITL
ncbi:MAG: P pilus assembly chaperone PapD [Alphaproteobacteria bacterium]|jgi:P pilus assembly chaperone PapD